MRRTLSAAVVAAVAALTIGGLASPASAVCGDGQLGQACYCPPIPGLNCWN